MANADDSIDLQAGESLDIKLESINSTALARLIEEVRNDDNGKPTVSAIYNRTYHRHNR